MCRDDVNEVFYCMQLCGRVRLEVDGKPPFVLNAGDFVLIPSVAAFTVSSVDPPAPSGLRTRPILGENGIFRIGLPEGPMEVQQLIGHFSFASPDADLLVSLLQTSPATLAMAQPALSAPPSPATSVILPHVM